MKNNNIAIILDRKENLIKGAYIKTTSGKKSVYYKLSNYNVINTEADTIPESEILLSKNEISNKRYEVIVEFYYEEFLEKYNELKKGSDFIFEDFIYSVVTLAKNHYISILEDKNKKAKAQVEELERLIMERSLVKAKVGLRKVKIDALENNINPYTSYTYQYISGYHPSDWREKTYNWINKKGLKINIGDKVICDTSMGNSEVIVTDIYYSTYKITDIKEVLKVVKRNTEEKVNVKDFKIGDYVEVCDDISPYYEFTGKITKIQKVNGDNDIISVNAVDFKEGCELPLAFDVDACLLKKVNKQW